MRGLACLIALVLQVSVAAAETQLAVLPPVGTTQKDVAAFAKVLAKAGVGTYMSGKGVDSTCAADPGCLIKKGNELGARRVIAVTVSAKDKVTVMLVDAGAKVLIGTRDIAAPLKTASKQLGKEIQKFVDEATVDKAKAVFAEGNEHFNLGEYPQALDKYKLAYRVKPLAAFQFNIAQCHRKLGQYKEAIAMYQAYLIDMPGAADRPVVESLIAESKKSLAEEDAKSQQLERDKIAADKQKAVEALRAKNAEAAAEAERAKVEKAKIDANREYQRQFNRHPARKWTVLTGVVGLAAGGVGIYFGTKAREDQRNFDDAGCNDSAALLDLAALGACGDLRDQGKKHALLMNVLVASGGAVVLTSLIVFMIDPGNVERPAGRTTVGVTPSSVSVMVRW